MSWTQNDVRLTTSSHNRNGKASHRLSRRDHSQRTYWTRRSAWCCRRLQWGLLVHHRHRRHLRGQMIPHLRQARWQVPRGAPCAMALLIMTAGSGSGGCCSQSLSEPDANIASLFSPRALFQVVSDQTGIAPTSRTTSSRKGARRHTMAGFFC